MSFTADLLNDTFTNRLHRIIRDHKLRTGRDLSWPDAVDMLDRQTGVAVQDRLAGVDLLPLRLFLAAQNYGDLAIETILADVRRDGTVWGSEAIDEEDVLEAEALIPVDQWDEFAGSRGRNGLAVRGTAR